MNSGSRRYSRLYAGALEHAGLGEAAYFLRKAKGFIANAQVSLDGNDPLGHVQRSSTKIDEITKLIGEALAEIDASERALVLEAEEREDDKSTKEEDE